MTRESCDEIGYLATLPCLKLKTLSSFSRRTDTVCTRYASDPDPTEASSLATTLPWTTEKDLDASSSAADPRITSAEHKMTAISTQPADVTDKPVSICRVFSVAVLFQCYCL